VLVGDEAVEGAGGEVDDPGHAPEATVGRRRSA
jgi:hypothetical protein